MSEVKKIVLWLLARKLEVEAKDCADEFGEVVDYALEEDMSKLVVEADELYKIFSQIEYFLDNYKSVSEEFWSKRTAASEKEHGSGLINIIEKAMTEKS